MAKVSKNLVPVKITEMCNRPDGLLYCNLKGLKCVYSLSINYDGSKSYTLWFCFRHPRTIRRFFVDIREWAVGLVRAKLLRQCYSSNLDIKGMMSIKNSRNWMFVSLVLGLKNEKWYVRTDLTDSDFDSIWEYSVKGEDLPVEKIVQKYGMKETKITNPLYLC